MMGRKRHLKGQSKSEGKNKRREKLESWKSIRGDQNSGYSTVLENKKFDAFYRAQLFPKISQDEDWSKFSASIRSSLPACFRINPTYAFSAELRKELLAFAGQSILVDGKEVKAVFEIPWYPNGYAYQLGTDRKTIRKSDALENLHKWMIQQTDSGNITRQEAVSMVPPLALNVEPHHICLDMCAAPGSKTSQLLEIINESQLFDRRHQGLVVANDSDTDR